jgi:hypothetical protein
VAFVSLAAWPALSWRREPGVPSPFRPKVALAAGGVLLAGLGWFFAELLGGGARAGLSERVAAGGQALWPLIAVVGARKRRTTSIEPGSDPVGGSDPSTKS